MSSIYFGFLYLSRWKQYLRLSLKWCRYIGLMVPVPQFRYTRCKMVPCVRYRKVPKIAVPINRYEKSDNMNWRYQNTDTGDTKSTILSLIFRFYYFLIINITFEYPLSFFIILITNYNSCRIIIVTSYT